MSEVPAPASQAATEESRRNFSTRSRGRAAFRGRGRGRSQGRTFARPQGYGASFAHTDLTIAPDQQHAAAAATSAVGNGTAERTDRNRASGQTSSRGGYRPQLLGSTSNAEEASGQRQPQQRTTGQSRQRAPRAHSHRGLNNQPGPQEGLNGQHAVLQEASSPATGAPECVVCCEPIQVVSVGRCNHRAVCERCSLRLIMLYQDARCPLCKADLDQVVMMFWTQFQTPDWSSLAAKLGQLWHKPKWSKTIFVDDQRPPGAPKGRPLHAHLQQLSAKACAVCDRQAQRPFASNAALEKHVREQHKQYLCHVCLEAQRAFPLELPVYKTRQARDEHVAEAHTYCQFCGITFFSGEELWTHIHNHHFTCQLCLRQGHHSHFAGPQDLTEHLRDSHFLCTEEACQDCFIAFSSLSELQDHHREFHRQRMPRWDPSRARQVALADVFPFLAPSHARPTGPGGRSEEARGRGRGRGRSQNRPGATQQQQGARQGHRPDAPSDILQAEGGMTMIDDDFPAMDGQSAGPLLANGPAAGLQRPQPSEPFPELSSAVVGAAGGDQHNVPSRQRQRKQAKPLVKVTVKCPCKRQISHQVVQEGQEPLPLHCNAACAQAHRQQQLAGAFGVEDPAHHISSFDRNRTPSYSPLLLTHAWSNKAWVQSLEGQLASFTAGKGGKRHSLPAMPRHQREVVHALAEQYGLASSSYKQEPHRYVELFKLPTSSIPNKLLSETVRGMTHEDIIACGRAAHGHPMRLTDLRQDVDVDWFLRQWDGQYNTEWHSSAEVVVRFTTPQSLKEALTALGGGIRGVFRVDRGFGSSGPGVAPSQTPSAASSLQPAQSSSSHQAKQAAASQQPDATDQWQTVKGTSGRVKGSKRAESGAVPSAGTGARAAPAYASASPLDFQEPWREDASTPGSGKRNQQQAKQLRPTVPEDELPEDWEQAEDEPAASSANGLEAQHEGLSDPGVGAAHDEQGPAVGADDELLEPASTSSNADLNRVPGADNAEHAELADGLGLQPVVKHSGTGVTTAHDQAVAEDGQGPLAAAVADMREPDLDGIGEQADEETASADGNESEHSSSAVVPAAIEEWARPEAAAAAADGTKFVSETGLGADALPAEADSRKPKDSAGNGLPDRAAAADASQAQVSSLSHHHASNGYSDEPRLDVKLQHASPLANGLSREATAAAASAQQSSSSGTWLQPSTVLHHQPSSDIEQHTGVEIAAEIPELLPGVLAEPNKGVLLPVTEQTRPTESSASLPAHDSDHDGSQAAPLRGALTSTADTE